MDISKLKAVNGYVIVRREAPATKTTSGLLLSGSEFKSRCCEVLSVSTPRNRVHNTKSQEEPEVKVGDRVLVISFDGTSVGVPDTSVEYVDYEQILMIIPKDCEVSTLK